MEGGIIALSQKPKVSCSYLLKRSDEYENRIIEDIVDPNNFSNDRYQRKWSLQYSTNEMARILL